MCMTAPVLLMVMIRSTWSGRAWSSARSLCDSPLRRTSASVRVLLPWSTWAITAKLRTSSTLNVFCCEAAGQHRWQRARGGATRPQPRGGSREGTRKGIARGCGSSGLSPLTSMDGRPSNRIENVALLRSRGFDCNSQLREKTQLRKRKGRRRSAIAAMNRKQGDSFGSCGLFRLGANLWLFTGVAHTAIDLVSRVFPSPAQHAVRTAAQGLQFHVLGVTNSYANLTGGFSLGLGVSMSLAGWLLVHVARLAPDDFGRVRTVCAVAGAASLAMLGLSVALVRLPPPIITFSLASAAFAGALWRS